MEQILIRNLPPGTKAALRARAAHHAVSLEAEARRILTEAVAGEPVTIVDLLWMEAAEDIDFEPERLGLRATTPDL